MFLTRVFGRTLFAAAKSESSSAAAAASTARMGHNPLEEFFEADRSPDEGKPVVYGRLSPLILSLGTHRILGYGFHCYSVAYFVIILKI